MLDLPGVSGGGTQGKNKAEQERLGGLNSPLANRWIRAILAVGGPDRHPGGAGAVVGRGLWARASRALLDHHGRRLRDLCLTSLAAEENCKDIMATDEHG